MIAPLENRPQDVVITLPSKPECVGWARHIVEDVARESGFSQESIEDIKLAVGEACNNAVLHGSPSGEENTVSVECCVINGSMVIEVRDQGPGFILSRQRKTPPMHLSEGGRGLVLIHLVMDDVHYSHSIEGGTLRMVKRLEN